MYFFIIYTTFIFNVVHAINVSVRGIVSSHDIFCKEFHQDDYYFYGGIYRAQHIVGNQTLDTNLPEEFFENVVEGYNICTGLGFSVMHEIKNHLFNISICKKRSTLTNQRESIVTHNNPKSSYIFWEAECFIEKKFNNFFVLFKNLYIYRSIYFEYLISDNDPLLYYPEFSSWFVGIGLGILLRSIIDKIEMNFLIDCGNHAIRYKRLNSITSLHWPAVYSAPISGTLMCDFKAYTKKISIKDINVDLEWRIWATVPINIYARNIDDSKKLKICEIETLISCNINILD